MINILIVTHFLDKGGVEEMVLTLGKFFVKKGYKITVAFIVGGLVASEIARIQGVTVLCFDGPSRWKRLLLLWRIARSVRPDIVHNHFCWYGLIVGLLVGAKRVETVHNTYNWFGPWLRYVYPIHLKLAQRIVVVSEFVGRFTKGYFPFMNNAKFTTIRNGIDLTKFQLRSDAERLRSELNISPTDIVVGFIGRLEEQKGISYLLQAAHRLSPIASIIKFVIVGDGNLKHQLTQQAEDLFLTNVLFLGFQRDTPRYYQIFDIYVLPSLFEGLPVSVIEAMATGCSVVATNVGGIGEAVEDIKTGFLIEPGDVDALVDKLGYLVAHDDERRAMGLRGSERARNKFSAEAMIAKIDMLYRDLLGYEQVNDLVS
jgi:glycosyltransferase involved in cell wall biosynthesis